MAWYKFWTWFGFSEENIKKKLENLRASLERKPEKAAELEGVLAVYQDKINKNADKIEDKTGINTLMESVKLTLSKAKQKRPKEPVISEKKAA